MIGGAERRGVGLLNIADMEGVQAPIESTFTNEGPVIDIVYCLLSLL